MYYSALIFYGLLAIAIIATLREPFWGVATYYYFSFFRPQDYYHWTLADSRLSYWIALITIYSFFINKARKGYIIPKNKETFLMLFFCLSMGLSTYFSPMPERSWPLFLTFIKIAIFYFFALAMIDSETKFKAMLWVLIYSFCYYAIWANIRYVFEGIKIIEGPGLAEAAYRDRNTFALIFVVAIPICFYMRYVIRHRLIKFSLLAMIPVLMHAVVCSFSRGAYLGMLAVSGYSILKIRRKAVVVLAILIVIPLVMRMQGKEHRYRMMSIVAEPEARDRSANSRIGAWKGGWKMMLDRPLSGVGLQNFELFIKDYNSSVVNLVAHNTYIQIGGEAGMLAMIAYILILLISFSTLYKLKRKFVKEGLTPNLYYYILMLEGSLVGFVLCSLFLSMEMFEPAYFLFCMVVILKLLTQKGAFNPKVA